MCGYTSVPDVLVLLSKKIAGIKRLWAAGASPPQVFGCGGDLLPSPPQSARSHGSRLAVSFGRKLTNRTVVLYRIQL